MPERAAYVPIQPTQTTTLGQYAGLQNPRLQRLAEQLGRVQALAVRTTTTATTLTAGDDVLLVDTTAGNLTITLPAASTHRGHAFTVKKTVAANTLTLDGAGAETIDGAATLAWATQWTAYTVVSDGTAWYVLSTR